MIQQRIKVIAILGILALGAQRLNATTPTNRVAVVVGENAPELERFAASELCGYLDKLFAVKTTPTTKMKAPLPRYFSSGIPLRIR